MAIEGRYITIDTASDDESNKYSHWSMVLDFLTPYLKEKKRFDKLQGDQNVIAESIKQTPENYKCFPDEWTFSAKWYDRANPRFQRSKWTFQHYPGAKVAVFHGKPDPLQLVDVHPHESYDMDTIAWVKKHWK